MDVSYFNGPNLAAFTPVSVSVPIDVTGPVTLQSATAPNNSGWTGLIVNGSTARFSGGVNSNNWDSLSGSTNVLVNIEDYTFSEKEPAFYLQLRTKNPNVRLSENMQIAEDEIDNEFYPKVVIAKSGQNPSNVAIEWLPETKVTESMQNSATLLSANPLQNDLIVRISLVEPTTITATLYDNTGRLMRQQSGRYLAGKSDINLVPDVSHLPSGAYHLELRTDASVLKAFKLIK
jgi:hypothetical protein